MWVTLKKMLRLRRTCAPPSAIPRSGEPSAWRPVLAVWLASRAFFLVVGAVGTALIDDGDVVGAYPEPVGALGYWAHWDGRWFAHIAQDGYDSTAATAFFPLYPLLLRAGVELGLGVAVTGVLVSTLVTLPALYFVHELARAWHGDRAAFAATVALAFFPTAFFLNAVYSDPLFLALSAGSLWAVYVRRDLLLAGFFAYFAAGTRNLGVLLVLPLAYEWLRHRREFGWITLVGVAGPVMGLVTYVIYLWRGAGEPLLFSLAYRQNWGRKFGNPLATLWHGLERARDGVEYLLPTRVFETSSVNPGFLLSNTLNVVFLAFAVVGLVLAVRRVPFGALLYAVPAALGPLTLDLEGLPLISYPRYVLVVFPLFIALGPTLARSRVALALWLAASATLGAYLTLLFVTWRWVA
jgi:hypothetical protein